MIATARSEPCGQSAPNDGRQGGAAQKGHKVNIYEQTTDKKGNVWYKAQAQNGEKVGYLRDYVVTLDKGASTTGSSASTAAAAEDLQDREVIGKATTNRAANVREGTLNATRWFASSATAWSCRFSPSTRA